MKDLAALELGQSFPIETSLKVPGIREAWEIWREMIDGAERTIDIEQFYMSTVPKGRMEPVFDAISRAVARKVTVRILIDRTFYTRSDDATGASLYAEAPDRLAALQGVTLRTVPMGEATGGVQHAKFFVVDGRDAWIGSQNFDWRSLEHISELGVRINTPELVGPLLEIFEADWKLSAPGTDPRPPEIQPADARPVPVDYAGQSHRAMLVASPDGWLPNPARFDLPHLRQAIDDAKTSVSVQLLTYDTHGHGADSVYWDELDRCLRHAAARGVRVRLMVGDWARKSPCQLAVLNSLAMCPNLDVRMVTVPEASSGPIPFARVIHTKILVVDASRSWIGTNNWTPDYFLSSRNVGLVVEGAGFAADLQRCFDHLWTSDHAYNVGMSTLGDVLARIRMLSQAGKLPIVIFDLDSTLLDPGPRNLRILHEFSMDYRDRWPWFAAIAAGVASRDIGYNLASMVDRLLTERGHDPKELVTALSAYWLARFFTNDYVALDLPNEGAVNFTRACHQAGAVIYYMTGRHRAWVPGIDEGQTPPFPEGMELGTLRTLARRGFPISDGRAVLHLKPRFDQKDEDFKQAAFPILDELGGIVVATFENEPGNANQFLHQYPGATHFWLLTEYRPDAPQPDPRLVHIEDFHVRPYPPT